MAAYWWEQYSMIGIPKAALDRIIGTTASGTRIEAAIQYVRRIRWSGITSNKNSSVSYDVLSICDCWRNRFAQSQRRLYLLCIASHPLVGALCVQKPDRKN